MLDESEKKKSGLLVWSLTTSGSMRKCVHLDGKLILREFFDIQKLNANKLAIYEIKNFEIPGELFWRKITKKSSLVERQNDFEKLREAEAAPTLAPDLIDWSNRIA
jgi:hypothetical protein